MRRLHRRNPSQQQPLRFKSVSEAKKWLSHTGHYGMIYESFVTGKGNHFIILVPDGYGQSAGTWAFAGEDKIVKLVGW